MKSYAAPSFFILQECEAFHKDQGVVYPGATRTIADRASETCICNEFWSILATLFVWKCSSLLSISLNVKLHRRKESMGLTMKDTKPDEHELST